MCLIKNENSTNIYASQNVSAVWHNVASGSFMCCNGAKQGGVFSPILFGDVLSPILFGDVLSPILLYTY